LRMVVRRKFKISSKVFSEEQIKVLWCAVDDDNSNSIALVEFGRFIKLATAPKRRSADSKTVYVPPIPKSRKPPEHPTSARGVRLPQMMGRFQPTDPRRPNTAGPLTTSWRDAVNMSKGKFWNARQWAPTTEETNYMGGPWAYDAKRLKIAMMLSSRKPSPPSVPPSQASSPRTPSSQRSPRPLKANERSGSNELLDIYEMAEQSGRWPYPHRFPGTPKDGFRTSKMSSTSSSPRTPRSP